MTNPLNKYRGQIVQSLIENNDQEMSLKPIQAPQQAQPVQPTQDVGIVPFDVPQSQKLPTTPVQPIKPQTVAPVTAVQPLDYDFTQGMNTPLPTQPVQPVKQQQFTQPGDYTQKNIGQTNYITQDEASYILERGLNTVGQWINLVPQIGGLIGLASTDTKRKTESLNMLADQLERSGRSREEVLKIRQEARKATKVGAGLDKFWSDVITYEIVADKSAEIEKKYEGKVDAGTKVLADVSSAALDMLPQTAIAYFSGGTYAMAYVFASSAARSTKEGLQMGATPDEAQTYGILNGAIEVGTEIIAGGWAGVPKGKFTGLARQGLLGGLEEITLKMAKSDLGKKAVSMAYQYLGEGAEEYLAEVLGNWAKGVIDPNMVKPWDEVQKDAAYAGLVGALTSVVMDVGRVGAVKIAERSALKQMEEFNSMSFEEQVGYATAMLAKTDTDLVFADEFAGQEVKGAGMMVTQDGKNTVVLPTRLQDGSENILTLSLVHEFTHTLEQKGIYNEFKSFVLKDLKRIGLLDALRQQKQALYENQGVQLSAEEIDQEIVATFVQDNLFKRVVMVDGKPQTFTDALAFRRFLKQMPKRQFNLFKNIAKGFLDSHYAGELNESIDQLNKEYNAAIKANDLELAEQIGAELSDLLQASNLVNPTYTKALELAFDQLVKDVEPAQQKRLAETTFKQDVIDKATPISQVNPKTTKYQLTDAEGDTLDVNPAVLKEVVASAKEIGLEEKELVAIHNVPIHKLMRVLDLGGFPMPSIAVTTDKIGHEHFGEISVVFKPDVLEGSPTYWRDAYTPRFPQIYSGFIKVSDFNKFKKQLEYAAKQALEYGYISDYDIDTFKRDIDALKRFMNEVNTSGWRNVMERLSNSRIAAVAMADMKGLIDWSNKKVSELKKTAENNLVGLTREQIAQEFLLYAGTFGASSYIKIKDVDPKTPDGKSKPISQLVMPLTADNVVQAMLTDAPIGAEGKTQAFNFDYLSPYVISVMKTKEEIKRQKSLINRMDNNEFFKATIAINQALDGLATTLAEIDRIKKNITIDGKSGVDRIMALASFGDLEIKARDAIKDYFAKFGSKPTKANFETFMKKKGYDISGVKINTQLSDFSIERVLIPIYLRSQTPNIKTITKIDYVYGQGVYTATVNHFDGTSKVVSIDPQEIKSEVSDILVYLISSIQSTVSPMFESKPQRVVGFDEIDTIVLPKMYTQNKKLMDLIEQNNINYQVYDLPTDRTEIVKSLSSAKFMLLPDENKPIPVPLKLDKATPISKVRPKNVKYQLTDANGMTLTPNEDKLQGVIDAAKAIGMDGKELVALHNLSSDNLIRVLKLGGFPMPSIAVTKAEIGHTNFGDISVVFNPDVLEGSPTYWRDGYTPRVPDTIVGFKSEKDLGSWVKNIKEKLQSLLDGGFDSKTIAYVEKDLDYYRYAIPNGYHDGAKRTFESMSKGLIGTIVYLEKTGQIDLSDSNSMKSNIALINSTYDNGRRNNPYTSYLMDDVRAFGGDEYLMRDDVDPYYPSGQRRPFAKRVQDVNLENLFIAMYNQSKLEGAERLSFVNFYTLSPLLVDLMYGKKSIKENASLLGQLDKNDFEYLASEINTKLSNIALLITQSGKLFNFTDDYEEALIGFIKRYGSLSSNVSRITEYFKRKYNVDLSQSINFDDFNGNAKDAKDAVRSFVKRTVIPKVIMESGDELNQVADMKLEEDGHTLTVKYWNKQNRFHNYDMGLTSTMSFNLKSELKKYTYAQLIVEQIDVMKNVLTPMFESKPRRIVNFNEIDTIVLPKTHTQNQELMDLIEQNNINYQVYDLPTDRTEIVKSLSSAKFMLTPQDAQSTPSVVVDLEQVKSLPEIKKAIKSFPTYIEPTPTGFTLSATRMEPENATESIRGGTYYRLTDISKLPADQVKDGSRSLAKKISVSNPLVNFQRAGGATFGLAGNVTVRNKAIIEKLFGPDGYADLKGVFDGILNSIENKNYTDQSLENAYRKVLSRYGTFNEKQIENIIDQTMKQDVKGFGTSFVKDKDTKAAWNTMSILDAIIFDKAKADGYDSIMLFGMYNDRRVPEEIRNEIAKTTDEKQLEKLNKELSQSEKGWFRPDELIILSNTQQTPIPNVGLFKTQFMLEDGKKRNFRRFPVAEKVDLVDWKRRYIAGANVILDYAEQTNTDTSKADVAFLIEALATKKIDPRTYFRIFNKFNQGNYIEYGSLYNIGQAADPWGAIAPFNAVYKRLEKQGKIKLNDAELDKWLDLIRGKQNRRTKAEWLKIAENYAANTEFKDEQDFMNHAIGTWKALAPNQKTQLNRQGEKYVEFKLQDWIQAMLDTKPDAIKLVKRDPKKKAININDIKDTEDAQVDAQDVVDEEPLPGEESRAMALEMDEQRQSTDELLRQEYGDVDEDAFEAQQARQEQEYIDYIQSLTDEQYQRFVADLDNETDAEYADTIRSQMATEQPTQMPIEPTTEEMMEDEEILADGKTETEIREFLADQGFTDEAIETEIEQLKLERDQEMATEEPTMPPAQEPVQVEQPKVEPIQDDAKIAQRKHPVTAANSGVLDEAQVNIVQRDLEQGKFDYVVMADKPAIERANKSIGNDLDAAFNEIKVLFDSGRRFKKDDMVKAEVLIQAYAAAKQTKKAMELLAMVAEIGTELGQSVQAMSVIKKMGAAGRLMAMDRVLKRLSKQYDNLELKISDELRNELLSKTDTKEMEDVVDKIKGEIAKQLPANFMDKLNAWRYLSMLGNPKTHIRNYLGNAIFWGVNKAKDSIGAALESVFVEQGKRTKTLVIDKKIKTYAKELFEEHHDEITGSGKYDINRDIESKKTIFKNKALEKARQLNFDWLEKEDDIYLRAGFIQALGQYMTAQGLTPETLTGKALDKAILVASEQAKKRTFRQTSNLATTLNNLEKDSKIGRFIIGSTVPFKKTPINILKAGYEFSPLGLFVNGISGINDVKNEKITPTEYIDRISAGLTGTGIALLGAWLYSMGLLTAGEDDEEGKRKTALERSLGFQRYSLRLGDWSVSLDWVAPAVMPLMIGAEMAAELNRKYDESILNIAPKALANIFNPAFELTMLQGVVEAMNTFEDGGASAIGDMFSTMASNYVTQFFPTVGGQMARTIDPTQRTTYSGSDFEGFLETTGRKILNKIPGGTYLNEPVVNIKGEEVKQPGDVWLRGIQQFLNPANIKENITDDTDREILRLFNQTGETSVIPPTAPSTFTYNGETIELGDGKTEYAKTLGSVSYNLLSEVFNHKDYDDLTDDIKAKVAADAYEYAVNGAKAQLLGKKGITFVNSTYTKILEAENAGIKVSDYLIMKNRFDTIKATGDFSRKENILAELVYGGYTDDEIYNYLVYVAGYSYLSSDQKYIDILRGVR